MRGLKEGDIFELKTEKGFIYLHFITKDESLGELIRILNNSYIEPLKDINQLSNMDERFYLFFPLNAANRKGIVKKVGNLVSSESFTKPKFMREKHYIKGKLDGWDIIDTNTWKRTFVKKLNLKQKKLSSWGIWNDTLLIERINNDWTLENWS